MLRSAASDLGLHCLPMSQKWDARFIRVKVLRLSLLILFKFRFYCPVNNILLCRAVTEYKKMVVVGIWGWVVCGGDKKAVRTQEREKLNVEGGQKRFSAPHILRAHP